MLIASDYHLRWFKHGRPDGEGRPVPFDRVPVTALERDAYREWRALNPAGSARISGRNDAARLEASRRQAREAYPDPMFPTSLPPFEEDGVWLSPTSELWVLRSRAARDSVARVDLIGADGNRTGTLRLLPGRRPLALDRRGVYLLHTDDDGLQRVERYDYPARP